MEEMDNALYFLIGASGAGKTAVSKRLEGERDFAVQVFYFDTIGVPSIDEMWKQFGSGEEWQRVKTVEWVATLKDKWLSHGDTLLDSQTRPAFIREACKKHGIENYSIILLDCDTGTRKNDSKAESKANLRQMIWITGPRICEMRVQMMRNVLRSIHRVLVLTKWSGK